MSAWRRHVVFGRGSVPADAVFIGEAPGKSEDLIGSAFIGASGQVADAFLRQVMRYADWPGMSWYLTNVCACRPSDHFCGPNREPTDLEALYCRPRLAMTIAHARPRVVVFFGQAAQHHAAAICPDGIGVPHPAWFARMGRAAADPWRAAVRTVGAALRAAKEGRDDDEA